MRAITRAMTPSCSSALRTKCARQLNKGKLRQKIAKRRTPHQCRMLAAQPSRPKFWLIGDLTRSRETLAAPAGTTPASAPHSRLPLTWPLRAGAKTMESVVARRSPTYQACVHLRSANKATFRLLRPPNKFRRSNHLITSCRRAAA